MHPFKAAFAFNALVKLIVELGDKNAKLHCDATFLAASVVPCDMLNILTDELACQMANRVEKLLKYVSSKCNSQWNRASRQYMRQLKQATLPTDSTTCPELESGFQVVLKSAADTCLLSEEIHAVRGNVAQQGIGKLRHVVANESVNPKFAGQIVRRYEPLLKLKGCDILFCKIVLDCLYLATS